MRMLLIIAIVLVILAGAAFARSCTYDDECYSDEYCDDGTCTSYSSSSFCCGPALILSALVVGAFISSKGKIL